MSSSITTPIPVMTYSSTTTTTTTTTSATHDSRHDDSRRLSFASFDLPPSYTAEPAIPLPEYTLHAPEPVTLAMYLFKFGFLFPPFWFFGAIILLSPLREPPTSSSSSSSQSDSDSDSDSDIPIPTWMPEKTEEERQKMIQDIRRVEVKWAWRCLVAFVVLVVVVTGVAVSAWFSLRQRR